ncbi:MAG: hypothetical protein IJT32_03175 [Lachnospiraceae bacterium]|nr:hypothetical protein [Lachnospiraceae bacterium]
MFDEEGMVLCGASVYTQKYYLNENFDGLPEGIKEELKIICVLYTEDVGGTIRLVFDEDGKLEIVVDHEEDDILFDEIGSALKVKQMRREKAELFEAMEMYYRIFFLGEDE